MPAADNNYTYGLKSITLSNPNVALYTETANPTKTDVQFTKDTVEYTFYPNADFVTVVTSEQPDSVTKTPYTLTVNSYDGATVSYFALSDLTVIPDGTNDEEVAKSIIENAKEENKLEDGKMTISEEGKYYVAAQIGTKYDLVEVTSMIDITPPAKPVLANIATESWVVAPKTYDFAGTSTSDDVASYKYALVEKDATPADEDWVADSSLEITASTNKDLYVIAVDNAGNESEISDKIAVTVDAKGPEAVTATAADDMNADGTWTITVDVTGDDDFSDLTVEVWKKGASEKLADVTDGSYDAAESGTYIFKAYDEVNAAVESAEVQITLRAAVVNGVEAIVITPAGEITEYAGDLVDTTAISGLDNNGSFTYLAYNVKAADDNFKNEVTLTKGEEVVTDAKTYVLTGEEAIGNYVLTVKTTHATSESIEPAEKSYKFSIVAADDIPSINNDKRWNIIDYTMIKWLVEKDTANALPTADYGFTGGIFAGDVDGTLSYDAADYGLIINAIKAGLRVGEYTFPVMNK